MFERFVARQAILKDNLTLLGYDLRFRAEAVGESPATGSSAAFLIDSSTMVFRWETLVGSGLAFFSFGIQELLSGAALILPRAKAVIELAGSVLCNAEVILAFQDLKAAGYRLSLGEWAGQKERRPLAVLADFLRGDFRNLKVADRTETFKAQRPGQTMLIAQGVDSWEQHREARALGFRCFQGDFFMRPQLFRRREVAGTRLSAMRLLRAILKDPLDLGQIENVVREEPALTYRLLRFLNSPMLPFRAEIHSVRHALILLGERDFRRWVSIVALVMIAANKPPELIRTARTRAYFCEELARPFGLAKSSSELFLMGMLSIADALLDHPMAQVLSELSLSPEIHSALNGGGGTFDGIYGTLLAYEKGDWARLTEIAKQGGCNEALIPDCYLSANTHASAVTH
jgi:c-di-GMP-related signal transduction protein